MIERLCAELQHAIQLNKIICTMFIFLLIFLLIFCAYKAFLQDFFLYLKKGFKHVFITSYKKEDMKAELLQAMIEYGESIKNDKDEFLSGAISQVVFELRQMQAECFYRRKIDEILNLKN